MSSTVDECRGLNIIVIQRNKFRNCQRKSVLGELVQTLTWAGAEHSVRNV